MAFPRSTKLTTTLMILKVRRQVVVRVKRVKRRLGDATATAGGSNSPGLSALAASINVS